LSGIVFYNTRSRSKEPFEPIEPGHVRIYSCGPTVYAPQHLGNLRPYLFADILKRTLLEADYRVTHVVNITDVGHLTDDADAGEDKMEKAAARAGRQAADIAAEYTEQWVEDRRRLRCLDPEVLCKATEHIEEQIALGLRLEEKGFTYRTSDGIYYDTSRFAAYADFAGLALSGQSEGGRIEEVAEKRNPADFAIWKFAAEGVKRQQEWESPWGRGFPGWHLECSAMSSKYLGEHFDIHTGGIDHVSVHHTNEIAQSEAAFSRTPWVNYWLHNEFIDFKGQKMSKSKGSVLLLQDLVDAGYEPLAYRYWFLQAHYRQQQSFTDEAMASAAKGYRRLLGHAAELRGVEGEGDPERQEPLRARFRAAMHDDLNAPQAMAVAWEVARSSELPDPDKLDLLLHFDRTLALDLASAAPEAEAESDPRIDALVAEREAARKGKDFAAADRIRDELAAEGIVVKDTPEGSTWKRE
jgi:cysteinyl-tRNA synthetase